MTRSRGSKSKTIIGSVRVWCALNLVLFIGLMTYHFGPFAKPNGWADTFSVAVNFVAGGLVSFFFYWLVVYLPEQRRRRVIKSNMTKMYRTIKETILLQVIWASRKGGRTDIDASSETIASLMTTAGFRAAFEHGSRGDEGFYAFENQMSHDTPEFREIIKQLEMLTKQVEFVLSNYIIEDSKIFDFFKRLELLLISIRQSGPGYDESKPLCNFVYEIFAGFNIVNGHQGYDVIEKMIAELDFVHYAAKQSACAIRTSRPGGILCISRFDGECR
ncbi:hypothetical protein [Rhizobium paranaense]|uniref:Uncharacterized protein n=1 Tax=Rhizobium paranaense TaxID=1650438 RepID=A0A7W9D597_9HYPH|nr:hypothetical protein [Rhizobium paranaense]MBB5578045.1 hypothetical protein [Rhizobium paranaense]